MIGSEIMVELHGWLSISKTYNDEDTMSEHELDIIAKNTQVLLNKRISGTQLRYANGSAYIDTLFSSNHRTAEVDEIISFYTQLSETATGSYGMIYLRDDEDKTYYNEFQVFAFRHGKCTKIKDKQLSPCIPMIEADIYKNNIQKED